MRRQSGTTTVEFAIVGVAFMLTLFGIIEVSRAMFTITALSEATRRGARMAVVCPVGDPAIARVAVFDRAGTSGGFLPGLTTANVVVEYIDEEGALVTDPGDTGFRDIEFVRVSITGYQHRLLIPVAGTTFNVPAQTTVLARESLGVPREGAVQPC